MNNISLLIVQVQKLSSCAVIHLVIIYFSACQCTFLSIGSVVMWCCSVLWPGLSLQSTAMHNRLQESVLGEILNIFIMVVLQPVMPFHCFAVCIRWISVLSSYFFEHRGISSLLFFFFKPEDMVLC